MKAENATNIFRDPRGAARLADAVGIRQPSLCHHFATKDDILAEPLDGTVAASLAFRPALHDRVHN
ncbi:hypothetical protein [Arthrobacter ramosus]|uniref:TetR family transcriptional regulator n=1 Tax=Arthrobacter ramosus TaxID=1672 RepID=A0ABV5Y5J2_ARTRM|nr:hypothetical protein [Arthrobacter ramosus]